MGCCDGKGFKCPSCGNQIIVFDKLETIQDNEDSKYYDVYKLMCKECGNKWSTTIEAGLLERGWVTDD